MSSYIFKVNDYKEIDLARISRENPDAEVLIVTGIKDQPSTARLLINYDFLGYFVTGDSVRIDGELLCPKWGLATIEDGTSQNERTKYHRWIHLASTRIPDVIKDIRIAKKYLKYRDSKHTIRVAELDISEGKQKKSKHEVELTVDESKELLGTGHWINPAKKVRAKKDLKAGTLVSLDDVLFIEDEAYQIGGPSIGDDKCEPCPIDPRENESILRLHYDPYNHKHCHDLKNNPEIVETGKTLIFAFNGTSKLNPEKVIVDGKVYVNELPF